MFFPSVSSRKTDGSNILKQKCLLVCTHTCNLLTWIIQECLDFHACSGNKCDTEEAWCMVISSKCSQWQAITAGQIASHGESFHFTSVCAAGRLNSPVFAGGSSSLPPHSGSLFIFYLLQWRHLPAWCVPRPLGLFNQSQSQRPQMDMHIH